MFIILNPRLFLENVLACGVYILTKIIQTLVLIQLALLIINIYFICPSLAACIMRE